jgi:hypothetical protein
MINPKVLSYAYITTYLGNPLPNRGQTFDVLTDNCCRASDSDYDTSFLHLRLFKLRMHQATCEARALAIDQFRAGVHMRLMVAGVAPFQLTPATYPVLVFQPIPSHLQMGIPYFILTKKTKTRCFPSDATT